MDLKELFGGNRLSFEELMVRCTEAGVEFGDLAGLRSEYDGRITAMKKDFVLERELDKAGVKNRALMEKVLDPEKITVDEDGVHGIAEQISALRASDPYLFDAPVPAPPSPVKWGVHHTENVPDPDSMGDAEYYKMIRKL